MENKLFKEESPFGPGTFFHHVGLAVHEIPAGFKSTHDPIQKVFVSFVLLNGFPVEFVAPADEKSPVAQFVKKGQKLYHLCYETCDMDAAIQAGRESGFHCIAKPVPATAFNGRKIAWFFHPLYGLVELVEKGGPSDVE